MPDSDKTSHLYDAIAQLGSVAVAFSGGTDSTLVLACSLKVLGSEHVLAITADSPTLPRSELAEAQALVQEMGAKHLVIKTDEIHDERFAANNAERCFYCKQDLFIQMRQVADHEGYKHLVYGATADDMVDYRPGMRAAREAGAIAPLLEAGLTKQDVRDLSQQMGLRTWNKPSMACLSSRFPYGIAITPEGLARVESAEAFLRQDLGFRQVRVRDQKAVARIEVEVQDLVKLVHEPMRSQVIERFKALGYTYVTLNLEGFRSGSLNDVLPETLKV
jgi:pyridinium-3,5-biscarboxylic acid mononucleotide sulfurtransferase